VRERDRELTNMLGKNISLSTTCSTVGKTDRQTDRQSDTELRKILRRNGILKWTLKGTRMLKQA
jgi:hypothetical protein